MSTLFLKLLGTAVVGAVASGTVSVVALDLAPADGFDWSKIIWPQMSALDTGAPRAAPQSELTATDVTPTKEEMADRPIPAEPSAVLPSAPAAGAEPGSGPIRIGDKLKVGFYERTELDEEKWGRQRSLRPAFQQRME